jgi:serine protease Do
MNGIVIRLAGIELPETRIFHQEVVTIGTAPGCDICLRPENLGLPPETLILALRLRDGLYRISTLDATAGVTRDGEAVAVGDAIQDGDTLYFGGTGIRLRFFALTEPGMIAESLPLGSGMLPPPGDTSMSAAPSSRSIPRTDVALLFVKQVLRELVAEIPRRLLFATAGAVALILLSLILTTLGFLEGRRNNTSISEIKQTLSETRNDIDKMREELLRAREESEFLRSSISLPEKVVKSYGRGVCLIYGTYSFIDPRVGREVHFKEPSMTDNPIGPDGTVNLSVDGNGPIYEVEFTGTGFLVDKGFILTNRHVVQPWGEDELTLLISMHGFRPRLKELLAYFPQVRKPIALRLLEAQHEQDVAICSFEQGAIDLPVLPLEDKGESIASGQPVVLIGYPAGLKGLRARVDQGGRGRTRGLGNLPDRIQLDELAASSKIRPQSTQGHISDVSPHLVYDARTDEGGSGGPVFGANGKVIGINQAILLNSQATTNFGVPIRYGIELLKKHQQQVTQNGKGGLEAATNQPPKS